MAPGHLPPPHPVNPTLAEKNLIEEVRELDLRQAEDAAMEAKTFKGSSTN